MLCGGRTLGVAEVDDLGALEDVDLLDAGDRVHAQPLQRVLQPLVVRGRRLVHRLLLSAGAGGGASAPLLTPAALLGVYRRSSGNAAAVGGCMSSDIRPR